MKDYAKKIGEYAAFIGLGGLIVLSLVVLLDVIGREMIGIPIPGFSDITGQLIIVSAAACFPASFAYRSHVSVRFLGQITHWRLRELLDFIGDTCILAVLGIFVYQLIKYSDSVWTNEETTWLLGIPIWPIWFLVSLLIVVSFFIQIIMTLAQLFRLFSSQKLRDREAIKPEPEQTSVSGGLNRK